MIDSANKLSHSLWRYPIIIVYKSKTIYRQCEGRARTLYNFPVEPLGAANLFELNTRQKRDAGRSSLLEFHRIIRARTIHMCV